jgi:branched-chain amino acid transport system ATP-binding protein
MTEPILRLEKVTKRFGGLVALNEISLEIQDGELFGLIGPNGAGKSTLINVTSGVYPASDGTVWFQGEDITSQNVSRVAKKGIQRTFQEPKHFEEYTGWENLEIATYSDTAFTLDAGFLLSTPSNGIGSQYGEILDLLDISRDVLDETPEDMNQLQLRKLAIARALINEPKLLLLDEPFAGLTNEEMNILGEKILSILDLDISILLIDHNVGKVADISDQMAALNLGEIIIDDKPGTVINDPKVESAYFGE